MFIRETFEKINYLVKLPKDFSPEKKYPAIIFMHGSGTRGTDLRVLEKNSFFQKTAELDNFPFVVFAPQCYEDTWFDILQSVNDFANYISERDYVDSDRVCLMGSSMGGYAVWQMAMSNPWLYAAIVPICGGGMYWNAARISSIPVWAFHGDGDPIVRCEESKKMVESVNLAGGNARLTVYENCQHDAWSMTYSNPDVFKWLLENSKGDSTVKRTEFNDN